MLIFNFHRSLQIFLFYVIALNCIIKCASDSSEKHNKNWDLVYDVDNQTADVTTPAPFSNQSSDQSSDQSTVECDSVENGENDSEIKVVPRFGEIKKNCIQKVKPNDYHKCGFRNIRGIISRSIGGKNSELFEFPWMVAIYVNISNTAAYNSAGTLIHPKVVLTVAHRTIKIPKHLLVVRAGESNLANSTNNLIPYQNRNVEKMIIHGDFNTDNYYNDIALLILDKPFDLSDNIRTICLPPPTKNFDNKLCTISTWQGVNELVDGIQKLDLPIVSNMECQDRIHAATGKFKWKLDTTFICAGGKTGEDSSIGDGGSPLICPIENTKNQYYQVGIVAVGIETSKILPAFYTNIPYLRSWIDQKVKDENISTLYYEN